MQPDNHTTKKSSSEEWKTNNCTCGECTGCRKEKFVKEFYIRYRILEEKEFIDEHLNGEVNG